MNENKYKKMKVAGTLIIPGTGDNYYYLLIPYPVRKSDDWMRDDMATFYVAQYKGIAHHIVVRGPFVIDYWNAGREIEVLDQDAQAEEIDYLGAGFDTEFLFETAEIDADNN